MFLRTRSGLSNRARFTRSDYTVYVEGGGGIAGAGSSDVNFWEDVLRINRPDLKFTIRPHGGKPQLESIAIKVQAGEINNTIVAMDADYDALLGELIVHPNILYTYGYSWENDAFDSDNLAPALRRILKGEVVTSEHLEVVKQNFTKTLVDLNSWINADFWLRSMNSSLFPNLPAGRFISNATADKSVNVDIRLLWSECRVRLKSVPAKLKQNRPRLWITSNQCFLQGHVIQFLMNCLVKFSMATLGRKKSVSQDHLENVMIAIMADQISEGVGPKNSHYRGQIAGIV